MRKTLKKVFALALVLSLAFGVNTVSAKAKTLKGIVAPLSVVTTDEGGLMGSTSVSCWNEPNIFSSDFSSYTVSADVYLPRALFDEMDGSVFIDPKITFWFGDLGVNGNLENDIAIRVGYDYENDCPFFKGLVKADDSETEDLSYVKNVKVIDDMIKVEIVDAPVNPTFKSSEWDEATGSTKAWTDAIPATGDACPNICVGADRAVNVNIVVANASVKIGKQEYKTDFSGSGPIAGVYGEVDGYSEYAASSFSTAAVSVEKAAVKVKAKKSATVKVNTMFSGDKVTVATSSAKIAKVTYKNGKVTIKGVKKGKAIVTVKANGKSQKIKVTVK